MREIIFIENNRFIIINNNFIVKIESNNRNQLKLV